MVMLAGCGNPTSPPAGPVGHARYSGVGTYTPGALWSQMAVPAVTKGPNAATPADDEHIIVVVDGFTGEVRACGDYSGACVSIDPWTRTPANRRGEPVALTRHLADVAREREAKPATGKATP